MGLVASGVAVTDAERQVCEVWSRVMGYHRPVSAYNKGKQAEHRDRVFFRESRAAARLGEVGLQAA